MLMLLLKCLKNLLMLLKPCGCGTPTKLPQPGNTNRCERRTFVTGVTVLELSPIHNAAERVRPTKCGRCPCAASVPIEVEPNPHKSEVLSRYTVLLGTAPDRHKARLHYFEYKRTSTARLKFGEGSTLRYNRIPKRSRVEVSKLTQLSNRSLFPKKFFAGVD